MSGRGVVGSKTGGKGSWRRKAKRQQGGDGLEAQKVWAAAQRLINHVIPMDSATIITSTDEDAYCFSKPDLIADQHANTYVIKGKPERKPAAEAFTDLLQGLDLSALTKKAGEAGEDLGDIPENLDFAKADEAAPAEGEAKKE